MNIKIVVQITDIKNHLIFIKDFFGSSSRKAFDKIPPPIDVIIFCLLLLNLEK